VSAMSRRKGAAAENEVVKYLRAHGFPYAEKRLAGSDDPMGDITGIPGVVIEVKNHATLDLGGWVTQLVEELAFTKADVGAVIHKRKGRTDVGDWYATLPAHLLVRLLVEAGYGQSDERTNSDLTELAAYHTRLQALRQELALLTGGDAA